MTLLQSLEVGWPFPLDTSQSSWLDRDMETTCGHKHCTKPVNPIFARLKYVEGLGMVPFHTDCSYAHPEYDVSKGCGSPFTTITLKGV